MSSIYFNIKFDDSSLNGSTKPLASQHIGFIPNLIEATSNIISRDEKVVNDSFPEAHCAGEWLVVEFDASIWKKNLATFSVNVVLENC